MRHAIGRLFGPLLPLGHRLQALQQSIHSLTKGGHDLRLPRLTRAMPDQFYRYGENDPVLANLTDWELSAVCIACRNPGKLLSSQLHSRT